MTPTANLSKSVTVTNDLGLHARTAARIAKHAATAVSAVWIEKDGQKVAASSVIDILTLACARGTRVTLSVDDPADSALLDEIVTMIENEFEEQR